MADGEETKNKIESIYNLNSNSPIYIRKAFYELERNNLEKAIEILKAGLEVYPSNPASYFMLARVYMVNGELKKAVQMIRNGSKLLKNRKVEEYYYNELNLFKQQHPELTIESLIKEKDFHLEDETPITKFTDNLPVNEELAKLYEAQGNINAAIEMYSKLIELVPERASFYKVQIDILKFK